ncbi:MAG TPA: YkgJ family cysteine cluster protein [Candidatus Angelobacter sp.]|nr:YkgJ family cysteine cluster protein [Candidatus Angelobacter sp.]
MGGLAPFYPNADRELVQIVDTALAEATRKSGHWLACRPGCMQCCLGPFSISQLDAARLRKGLSELANRDPERAGSVRLRARESVARLTPNFPGDASTGILAEGEEAEEKFAEFANDEPCPALDPATGTCDLYAARPMTCRTFGPPVRSGPENALGVCELCFQGATDEEIAACEMEVDPQGLEARLIEELEGETGMHGETIVAFSLIQFP